MRNVTIDELWAEARQLVATRRLVSRLGAVAPQLTTLASGGQPSWLLAALRTHDEPTRAQRRGSGARVRPGQPGRFRLLHPPPSPRRSRRR